MGVTNGTRARRGYADGALAGGLGGRPEPPMFLIAQDQDGHGRRAQHTLADPGRERAPKPAARWRRQRDQVGAKSIGLEKDLLDRLAEADDTLHRHAGELVLRELELRQPLRRESLHFLIDVRD